MAFDIEIKVNDKKCKDPIQLLIAIQKAGLGELEHITIKRNYTKLIDVDLTEFKAEGEVE
jgi:hypothetical protein